MLAVARHLLLLSLCALLALPQAQAQSTENPADWRWFEVEVLVFKHAEAASSEQFPWLPPAPVRSRYDLLTPYYAPNFWAMLHQLPRCPSDFYLRDASQPLPCATDAEIELPDGTPWYDPDAILASLSQVPTEIHGGGGEMERSSQPFLMPADSLQLRDFRRQLERRGVAQVLLHSSYRQPVFGRNGNATVRLFGGKNFVEEFLPNGYQRPPRQLPESNDDTSLPVLQQLLDAVAKGQLAFQVRQDQTPPPPPRLSSEQLATRQALWQLDGTLHIYLVGNYLHIESDLQLREPEPVRFSSVNLAEQADAALQYGNQPQLFLRRYELQQLRRVISHETHYFDHPKLGLVVQIRRTDLSARR